MNSTQTSRFSFPDTFPMKSNLNSPALSSLLPVSAQNSAVQSCNHVIHKDTMYGWWGNQNKVCDESILTTRTRSEVQPMFPAKRRGSSNGNAAKGRSRGARLVLALSLLTTYLVGLGWQDGFSLHSCSPSLSFKLSLWPSCKGACRRYRPRQPLHPLCLLLLCVCLYLFALEADRSLSCSFTLRLHLLYGVYECLQWSTYSLSREPR